VKRRRPPTPEEKRVEARKRQTKCRRLRKMRADGFEPVTLIVPKAVRLGWAAREQLTNSAAPPPWKHYNADLVDVLVNWARPWLDKMASQRDRSN
jgi:hypothetical protein